MEKSIGFGQMERTIPKNGKKKKSCVLLKELSKIYDIMK